MYLSIAIAVALVMLSAIACATEYQPTPVPQPKATGCSIGGRPVSCDVFQDHTIDESIADFTGLDCDAMANIAVSRLEGWALAESMGRVSYEEAESASYAIGYAVGYLGCGDNRAFRAYFSGSR